MKRTSARYVVAAGAIVALVLVNAMANAVLPQRWDWTRDGNFTLSRQTYSVLAGVSQPMTITLLSPREPRSAGERSFQQAVPMLRELFKLYQQAHPALTIAQADTNDTDEGRRMQQQFPDAAPPCVVITVGTGEETRHEVLQFRDLVDVRGRAGRVTVVDCLAESAVTAALARLSSEQPHTTVYVSTGHGELSLDDAEPASPRGLGVLGQHFASLDYDLRPLELRSVSRVPPDADLVLIAGPVQPFSSAEAEQLNEYLANGGRVLILADFVRDPLRQEVSSTGLEELLADWGVQLGDDRVITRGFTGQLDAASPALPSGSDHPLVRSLPLTPVTLLECRSLRALSAVTQRPTLRMTPLLVSHPSPRAWAEGDLDLRRAATPGSPKDTSGPVIMAAAIERKIGGETLPAMVIVGDAEFACNRSLSNVSGRPGYSFLLSSLNWLRGRAERLGDIAPRRHETLVVSTDLDAFRGLAWKSTLFLCAVIVTAGTTVWTARRTG